MTPDLALDLAALAATTRYENLPAPAIEAAKKSILDTVGVAIAASGLEPAVRPIAELALDAGGRADCVVLGFGGRASAPMAAFVNGALAHCLDFDDRTPWGSHASSSAVPAALAVAQHQGGITGTRLIAAVAVAQDIFVRLRCNVGWRKDWNPSSVIGVFSATAAAASVLGLSAEQAHHALGIASMEAAGTMQMITGTGSDLRGMYAGFSAKGAVIAALLAQKGLTGVDGLFEGEAGIINAYFGGAYDRAQMLADLGRDFRGAQTLYKPWPAVGISHTYIHAMIHLMRENGLRAADLREIRLFVGDFQQRMCNPFEARRAPKTLVDAKFSLPYCVALAAVHGNVGISHFAADNLADPVVLETARRIVSVQDDSRDWKTESPIGRIEVLTTDGRTIDREGRAVPGSAEAPLSWADLERKFRDCAAVSAKPLAPATIERALQVFRELESVNDIGTFCAAVHPDRTDHSAKENPCLS